VIEPPAACEPTEAALDFSQRGPAGPPGATGPAGGPARPADSTGISFAEQAGKPAAAFTKKPKALGTKLAKQLAGQDETDAFSTYHDGPVDVGGYGPLANRMKYIADLELPAGRWVIGAKSNATAVNLFDDPGYVECTLVAGTDYDRAWATNSTLALTVLHRFTKPGRVDLRCAGWLASMTWTKITATRVGSFKNTLDPP
jgi:hypothetical protein